MSVYTTSIKVTKLNHCRWKMTAMKTNYRSLGTYKLGSEMIKLKCMCAGKGWTSEKVMVASF
jgi:hypothetical protein